jgi:photosystem II stability/assembly factor-like uncharacterized protein
MDKMTTKNLVIRTLGVALVALLSGNSAGAQEWQEVAWLEGGDITGICFVHPDTGFVVTSGGLIGRSDDGGKTWRMKKITAGAALEDVSFLSGNLGFVCGRAGSLYRTLDGGNNWDDFTLKDTIPWLFDVEMLDATHILVAGATRSPDVPYEGLLLRSTNGGADFETLPTVGVGYKEFFYRRGESVYLLTMGGLSRSDDLGENWETGLTIDGKPGRALSFAGQAGLMAGPRGMIAYSSDSGRTWRTNDRAESEIYIAAEMIDDKVGYIGGYPGTILRTNDGGRTWEDEKFAQKFNVLDFCLIGDRLYAVGAGGGIAVKKVK